jgi:hypothetical protein
LAYVRDTIAREVTMLRTRFLLGLVLLIAAGCASRTRTQTPAGPTILEVENQTTLDMSVYVLRNGTRERLGSVTAKMTQWFTIPERLLFGLTALRFQTDPVGGGADPVTHEITVIPGDTIVLRIPPR